ncbi:MAG: fused MFS/spermidine synthase [Myxococcota bacterium]
MNPELAEFRRHRAVLWLVPLFLASGATSLVYQTVWERQLNLIFGTSQIAVSTVLAAFMTGLAMGGFSGGRRADKIKRPIRAYAFLEFAIGVYAVAFPWLLDMVQPLYLGFYHMFQPSPTMFATFQFVLLGSMLLPPTFCMGMTLPLLARFATMGRGNAGTQIGRLYGANTIGAVAGTGLAGFVLLPSIGLGATTWAAGTANVLLCFGALALSRTVNELPEVPEETKKDTEGWGLTVLGLVALLAGLSSLLYEVAWFRLMALILGASAYAFSVMLFSFLFGIGTGGWLGGPLADRLYQRGGTRRVLAGLAVLEIGIGLFTWAAMYFYAELPWLFVAIYDVMSASPLLLWMGKLGLAMLVMMPPAILMGLAFPLLVRAAAGESEAFGKPVGRLYGWNTVGAILGASLGGLVFLPWLYVRGTIILAISINIAAGCIALYRSNVFQKRGMVISFAGGAVLASVLGMFSAPWNPLQMTAGTYKYVYNMDDRTREGVKTSHVDPYELLFYEEGLSSVVTVARNKNSGDVWLANNGKIDASSKSDMPTQVLVAHMPFFYRPESETVMMLGLAAGYSAGSTALHTKTKVIDLVEIEESIIEASHFFDEWNHKPLEDPRVVMRVNDARNHLMLTPDGYYDLIVAEPSNPWLTGVSNLFTAEYFAMGKSKLKSGGIWSQWIQIYGMDSEDLKSLLGTFSDTYEHVHLFSTISDADLVLVGSDAPLELNVTKVQEQIDANPRLKKDLEVIGIDSSFDILARYRMDRPKLQQVAEGIERNTDDNMRVEYSAPLHLYTWTGDENVLLLEQAVGKIPLIPFEATDGASDIMELAMSYAEIELWVEALMCIRRADELLACPADAEEAAHAASVDEADPAMMAKCDRLQSLYTEYQKAFSDALGEQEEG